MWRSRNKLYKLLLLLCFLGYAWLLFNHAPNGIASFFSLDKISSLNLESQSVPVFCFFKNITGYPCPSCGITRSVSELFHGNIFEAIYMNPLGIIVFLIITTVPFWIFTDLILKKSTFWFFYRRAEVWFAQKKVFIPFIALTILNWIWNFFKGY